jgi:hypothetical protein
VVIFICCVFVGDGGCFFSYGSFRSGRVLKLIPSEGKFFQKEQLDQIV